MIVDEILYEVRRYKEVERGEPSILKLSPDEYAELVEYYGHPEQDINRFHGMTIEVSTEHELNIE